MISADCYEERAGTAKSLVEADCTNEGSQAQSSKGHRSFDSKIFDMSILTGIIAFIILNPGCVFRFGIAHRATAQRNLWIPHVWHYWAITVFNSY